MHVKPKQPDPLVNETVDFYVVSHNGEVLRLTESLEEAEEFAIHCTPSPVTVSAVWATITDAEEHATYERRHEAR